MSSPGPESNPSSSALFNGQAARDFFLALQVDPATVHYRGIHWDREHLPKEARGCHISPSPELKQQRLEDLQKQGYRLYWLPNGGPSDRHVRECRFLFVEWDGRPLEWQEQAWKELNLPEPTVMLNTGGKSIHAYWRLREPIDTARWRALIVRLIDHCESDPSCKNPSRPMRLAGGTYIYKSDDVDAEGNNLGGKHGPLQAAIVSTTGKEYDAATFESLLPEKIEQPVITPPSAPMPPPPSGTVTPDDPRTYEELERLVSAYPTILADNDQYHEALSLIFGLCKCMEEIGRSRQDAIDLASRYHPEATDTFAEALKADISKSQGGSFIKQCKKHGVDTRRHDIKRKPVVEIAPDQQFERPGSSPAPAAPAPWEAPLAVEEEAEDREAQAEAAASLLAAGKRDPLTLADILPKGLAEPLTRRAEAFPCDPMAFALPLLCCVASVVGNRVLVKVKGGWKEPFVLWGATIMPASSLKSPIAKVPLNALGKWQVEFNKASKAEKAQWAQDRNRVVLEADAQALKEWEKENPPPLPGRELFIVDATLEKIGQFIGQEKTPGMVAFHDELSLWFQQLKRGKEAQDQRSNWLSLWTGGLLKVDRVGRDSIYVADTAQSVFGLATVDGLAAIRAGEKASNGNKDADGMWARFLLWQPIDIPFDYNDLEVDVTDLLLNLFRDKIDAKLPKPEEATDKPLDIRLSPEAVALMWPRWKEWDKESRLTTKERGQWLGKLRGHSVRLAGILQLIDNATKELPITGEVSAEMAKRALNFCYALLDQYDLLCPKIGGDTGALDPAVAKLLANGMEWRREHGAAPISGYHINSRWKLPERGCRAPATNAWLLEVIGTDPNGARGWIESLRQGVRWHPPR